jgi:glycosyltransferase involved in cell wall biosynthesis
LNVTEPKPKIQVYIPVFNDVSFLPDAVNSALSQQDVDVEVIVSDNASTDGTFEWLEQAASRDRRLVVHRNSKNLGMLTNINRFRDLVTADFYLMLCSDDRLGAPDALSSALKVMRDHADVVSVYADMLYIDRFGRGLAARRFGRDGRFAGTPVLKASIMSGRNLFGIPLLHRRVVGTAVGYPEAMTYVADVYHSAKCANRGTLFHLPRQLIHNRFSGGNATGDLYRKSLFQFGVLANDFGIKLTPAERILQKIWTNKTVLSKAVFLRYAGWRSRSTSTK